MSRDRVKRLAPVRQFAQSEADEAGAALADAQQQLSRQRATLEELTQYRGGYAQTSGLPGTWQGQHWADYNEFLTKLDAAIEAQRDVILQHELRATALRKEWQKKHARSESLQQLAERLRKSADTAAALSQQKIDDEMAIQRHGRVPFD